jgi:hypothetical protein
MSFTKCTRAAALALLSLAAACADGGALPTAPAAQQRTAAKPAAATVSLHQHRSGYVLASGRGGSATVAPQKQ